MTVALTVHRNHVPGMPQAASPDALQIYHFCCRLLLTFHRVNKPGHVKDIAAHNHPRLAPGYGMHRCSRHYAVFACWLR